MVGGTDNGRQKTRNHGYDVIVGGELFTDYSDHPRKLVTLNSKTQINSRAGRYQLLSRWWDAYRKQLGLLSSLQKSDAVALQQIKERGALPMIDRGDIRQAIDRCSNIWASLPGAGYGQFGHGVDSHRGNPAAAERIAGRKRNTAIISCSGYLLHHRLPVMGC